MKKILSLVAVIGLTTSIYANDNTGCGLGSLIIKKQDTVALQVLAATTNGTSGSQTFGITSGTSNCSKPNNYVSNDKLNRFVSENMDELALDISAGHGETLATVAKLMNVEDNAAFSSKLQANFTSIYSSENVTSATVIDSIAKYM
ncbi:DUF3015 domain-containing protein [Arcobacter venerupis]|uniref:DUF3015 domain-containing protein n=1 Tax=Arcobacter venerupis TaxID=1054033 RepID=A0AAE7B918_9BACT|nr:DUF3015 family protein [Arcobacter venerupis]QKF66135.1 DUF3015 domain-containing protein [Arcobacter venerupis]RWS51077.1 hypothetical protein CKA56_01740 [Arcobacter venerupis]